MMEKNYKMEMASIALKSQVVSFYETAVKR